jgi:hypothetical protein
MMKLENVAEGLKKLDANDIRILEPPSGNRSAKRIEDGVQKSNLTRRKGGNPLRGGRWVILHPRSATGE